MAENQTTAAPETAAEPTAGRVTRIQGSVIDVEFPVGHLPDIYNALFVSCRMHEDETRGMSFAITYLDVCKNGLKSH